ncbi:MAG: NAD(P)-dependent oxidoreductase [Terracidiphilus sp.]|jgi:GDP-4-dehydro-6-deoxy-D-mannose reductase
MNTKKVLITGGSGFVGQHMSRLLLDWGYRVFSLQRNTLASLPDGVDPIYIDLKDPKALKDLPRAWDFVIHLAGASIPSQFTSVDPVLLNVRMVMNLLEHLEDARVLLVSSCHVYAPSLCLRAEESPIIPQGRYGLAKHLIEQMAGHYEHKLDIRIARPFNHLGPYQRQELVIPSLLRRIRMSGSLDRSAITMSGTNSTRDFVDVADVVAAYLAILQIEVPNHRVFNVCTGTPLTIKHVADLALQILEIEREIAFEGHPNSADDNPFVVGSPARLMSASNWRPHVPLRVSLERMLLS